VGRNKRGWKRLLGWTPPKYLIFSLFLPVFLSFLCSVCLSLPLYLSFLVLLSECLCQSVSHFVVLSVCLCQSVYHYVATLLCFCQSVCHFVVLSVCFCQSVSKFCHSLCVSASLSVIILLCFSVFASLSVIFVTI
jgi:hypothetical protein